MKRLVLTGGGTAGHVTPHLALIPFLEEEGYELHYIGTRDGIERSLIPERIPYYSIAAGKLRRYLDWKNLTDPFRVLQGSDRHGRSCARSVRMPSSAREDLLPYR